MKVVSSQGSGVRDLGEYRSLSTGYLPLTTIFGVEA